MRLSKVITTILKCLCIVALKYAFMFKEEAKSCFTCITILCYLECPNNLDVNFTL